MFIGAIAALFETLTVAIEAAVTEELSWSDMGNLHAVAVPASARAPKTVEVFGTVMTKKERNRMVRDARKLGVRVGTL